MGNLSPKTPHLTLKAFQIKTGSAKQKQREEMYPQPEDIRNNNKVTRGAALKLETGIANCRPLLSKSRARL